MGFLHIIGVGFTGALGATLGAFIIFLISKKLEHQGLNKYLKYAKINEKKLDKADIWFESTETNQLLLEELFQELES